MPRKINDKNINLDPNVPEGLTAEDIGYTVEESVKVKLDRDTLPSVSLLDDNKILESYAVLPEEYGDEFDGSVSTSGVINEYTHLTTNVTEGSTIITVSVVTAAMVPGREIMLHQTQSYRDITKRFQYEFVKIQSVDGLNITLVTGLKNAYISDNTGDKPNNTMTQVITVPNYNALTLTGEIAASSWDGHSGGILAFRAKSIVGSASLSAAGRGFRSARYRSNATSSDYYAVGEGPLGKYDHSSPAPGDVPSELKAQCEIPSPITSGDCMAQGGLFTSGGSAGDAGNVLLPAAPVTYNGSPITVFDLVNILPMATASIAIDSNSNDNYWITEVASGGIICCFVQDVSEYAGTVTVQGGGGYWIADAGGAVRFQTPSDPGYTGVFNVSGSTSGLHGQTAGSGGYKTGAGPNPLVAGFKKGRKISNDYPTSQDTDLLEKQAIAAMIQGTSPPPVQLGEWSGITGVYVNSVSLVSHDGKIWRALQNNDFNAPKEPGVDIGYWLDITDQLTDEPVQSLVNVNTNNGYGSDTNNRIRRFTNLVQDIGADIAYVDDAVYGATFTINKSGIYAIAYTDHLNSVGFLGISKNSDQLALGVENVANDPYRLASITTQGANADGHVAITIYLTEGDVIRAHGDGSPAGTSPTHTSFTIARVGDLESKGSFTRDTVLLSAHVPGGVYSVSGSGVDLPCTVVQQDKYNAYDTLTGYWTAPAQMNVRVSAKATAQNTDTNAGIVIYRNGSAVETVLQASTANSATLYANKVLMLEAGDVIRVSVSKAVTGDWVGGETSAWIQITEELAGDGTAADKGELHEFTNADLVAGILTITHQLNQQHVLQTMVDNVGDQVPVWPKFVNTNTIEYDLTGITVTGTWSIALGIGGRSLADIMTASQKDVINADYDVINIDAGRTIDMNSSVDQTVNINLYSVEPISAAGRTWLLYGLGTGNVSVQAAAGVILNGVDGGLAVLSGSFSGVSLRCKDPLNNIWILDGHHGGVT